MDGGATWNNGTYIGNSITFAGANCCAGDYVSIVQDPPNSSYFFTWGQNTPNWTIQGAVRGKQGDLAHEQVRHLLDARMCRVFVG